jgi:predicted ATPase
MSNALSENLPPPSWPAPQLAGQQPSEWLQLPANAFIGRDQELEQICALLGEGRTRLLTLTGPGGVGKTRLALEAAARLRSRYAQGQQVVGLETTSNAEQARSAIALALGVVEEPGLGLETKLSAALREQHLLLVLDNIELVQGARELVGGLLAAAPQLSLLITSRRALRLRSEQIMALAPLASPSPRQQPALAELAAAPAVQLFIARAQATLPGFMLSEENAQAVLTICRKLDGLPLAIELAAAQIHLLPPAELIAWLDQWRPLAAEPSPDLPARHHSLANVVAWSYDLLGEAEQRLLRRLAVFAGGASYAAIERVCQPESLGGPLLSALGALADHSLILREAQPDGTPRIRLLETIRAFAAERLAAAGELRAFQHRHALAFLDLAASAAPQLYSPSQARWLDQLEREHDNLRAALSWSMSPIGDGILGLRIVSALARFWHVRGHLSEGQAWFERLLHDNAVPERFLADAPRELLEARAGALLAAGMLAVQLRDTATAEQVFSEALALQRAIGNLAGEADALRGLGNVANERGDLAASGAYFAAGLAVAERAGVALSIGPLLNNLGMIALYQGRWAEATGFFTRCLAVYEPIGDTNRIGALLNNLSHLALRQGDTAQAAALMGKHLAISMQVGYSWGVAHGIGSVAMLAAARGQPQAAAWLLGAALRYPGYRARLDRADRADFESLLAQLQADLGPADLAAAQALGTAATDAEALTYAQAVIDEGRAPGL